MKNDIRTYPSTDHPCLITLIDSDLDNWLESLRGRIENGSYSPSEGGVVDVPKKNWHLRPRHLLTKEDSVVYSALVLDALDPIRQGIGWSSQKVRLSSLIKENQRGKDWFEFNPLAWRTFQARTGEILDKGFEFAVFTDVASFYENVDTRRLISDLRDLGVSDDNLDVLGTCLNAWAGPRRRGIPQGYRPSAILSEVYLNAIDQRLVHQNETHLRYSDDLTLFCHTEREAVDLLRLLTELYRDKGLNLHTAKSRIYEQEEARKRVRGIPEIFDGIQAEVLNEVQRAYHVDSPYLAPSDLRALMGESVIQLTSLQGAFDLYFTEAAPSTRFNNSLFHFIINRLAAVESPYAVKYCFWLLTRRPEETKSILAYFGDLQDDLQDVGHGLARMLTERALVYEYQTYMIVRWFWIKEIKTEIILAAVRWLLDQAFGFRGIWEYCVSYLGRYGTSADLDRLETLFAGTNDDTSRATVICSLRRMEKARRNAVYQRAARAYGDVVRLAVAWSRGEV